MLRSVMRSYVKRPDSVALQGVVSLLAVESLAVLVLGRLGSIHFLRTPGIDVAAWGRWLMTTPPEDAAAGVARAVATVAAWWLLVSTATYLLARLSSVPSAARTVGWCTPAAVRRVVDWAVVLSLAVMLAGGSAALAAGTPPPVPIPLPDPVSAPTAAPAPEPSAQPPPEPPPRAGGSEGAAEFHLVRTGECLWTIAADRLRRDAAPAPSDRIVRYWHAVVTDARPRLRSGNPDLIFPGESVPLP